MVSVVQREWAAKNPRATLETSITVENVLNLRMIAYPFRLLQCCRELSGASFAHLSKCSDLLLTTTMIRIDLNRELVKIERGLDG